MLDLSAEQLNQWIVGKTIKWVRIDDRPAQDITIHFTDETKLAVIANGDDMAHITYGIRR